MTPSPAAPHCELLPWDSEFWGLRIGRVTAPALRPGDTTQIASWSQSERVDCLYFLAPSDDRLTVQEAEQAGYALVDLRLTLETRPTPSAPAASAGAGAGPATIRLHRPDDVPGLERLAAMSHRDSRFYFDGRFPHERCDALYATWMRRSCEGWADAVLVAEVDGAVAGYVTCHLDSGVRGRIGIIGVGEQVRGRGVGQHLVRASLDWFGAHSATLVSVVTQGRNVQAQRLYQRCGFVTASVHLWYHRWSDGGDAA